MVGELNSRLWDTEENKCHFTLFSLVFFALASSVFFYPPIFLSFLSFFFAFELCCYTRIPLCSIIHYVMPIVLQFCNVLHHEVLPPSSSSPNVFVHMQQHASEERRGKRVDLLSVLPMHTYICT